MIGPFCHGPYNQKVEEYHEHMHTGSHPNRKIHSAYHMAVEYGRKKVVGR